MRKYFNDLINTNLNTYTIDYISFVGMKKKITVFCAIGLLCTIILTLVTASNINHALDTEANISIAIETTNAPYQPTYQPTYQPSDILIEEDSIQVANAQVNEDISIVTRSSVFQDLRSGSKGTDVEKIQQALTLKGYYNGPVNSKFGPLTEAAVIEFQKSNGLDGSGIVDQRLLNLICAQVTLKNGSEGEDVNKLQQKLKEKGFYDGPIIGKFGPQTETAVKAFQKKIGIEANGIVTLTVMYKLNSYNPPVTIAKSNEDIIADKPVITSVPLKPAANGVELLEWSKVKTIFSIGVAASVYDVRSGLTYKVKSFSNGSHADVEPITTEDTAIMLKTYGGTWKWDPRPVWVTVNGRTIAGSINGMPHGSGVNTNNNMNGQICIHFKGSTTHNGNQSFDKAHQDGVMEAWYAQK